ncbi:flagellar basal body L-ring protein FlgH [Agarivorans sp. DSG3-1]|uniref:flagellar basal body L-ring protein FlgH n=1 Tax=Agarivorans sp. DSG3-1 TaxID=3342249 RepID=UPI00398E4F61
MSIKVALVLLFFSASGNVLAEDFFGQGGFSSLVSDNRAHQVGDTLTVLIVESTEAKSRAGSGSETKVDIDASIYTTQTKESAGLGYGRDSIDDANTRREGYFKGQISVRVNSVDEFGMLNISGEQVLLINGEEQRIGLSGVVRPIDVRDDNTVLSSRLTNSRIEFNGNGVVNDGQTPGIISRIFGWFGL